MVVVSVRFPFMVVIFEGESLIPLVGYLFLFIFIPGDVYNT